MPQLGVPGQRRVVTTTEVMVNGADDVYVERKGRIERVQGGLFEGEEAVLHVIERIVAPLGLRVDESSPYADARLPDGSRVQTRFLGAPFSGGGMTSSGSPRKRHSFAHHAIQPPAIGNTLQLVLARVLERKPRSGYQILHRL